MKNIRPFTGKPAVSDGREKEAVEMREGPEL